MPNAPFPPIKAVQQRGLSVVELLISLVIGMAVIAGSIQVVVSSKRSFMDQDEVSFIQANARYALDVMSKDIRMAGYMGCATPHTAQMANSINVGAPDYISLHGLRGFEGEANTDGFPADFKADVKEGTDAILIRRAADTGELDVKGHNPASAVVDIWGAHEYPSGSILMIVDASCRNVGLFQTTGSSTNKVNHNTGAGTPGNCTKIIKGNFNCNDCMSSPNKVNNCAGYGTATGTYSPGSKIMQFVAHAYYIGESTVMPGMPALRRQAFNTSGGAANTSEEIALGVEDMEILYGVDSNNDGNVDQMRKASEIASEDDWETVISVQISLVFRSQMPVLNAAEKKTLAGTEYNDRYMRQVVNSTIRIRNRG